MRTSNKDKDKPSLNELALNESENTLDLQKENRLTNNLLINVRSENEDRSSCMKKFCDVYKRTFDRFMGLSVVDVPTNLYHEGVRFFKNKRLFFVSLMIFALDGGYSYLTF